jgi:hypothetical protein
VDREAASNDVPRVDLKPMCQLPAVPLGLDPRRQRDDNLAKSKHLPCVAMEPHPIEIDQAELKPFDGM